MPTTTRLWKWYVSFGGQRPALDSLFFASEPEVRAMCGKVILFDGVPLLITSDQFTEVSFANLPRTLAGVDLLTRCEAIDFASGDFA